MNIAVLVDGPGAGTKVDDLRQLARHAGLRVAPVGYKWPEPFQAATGSPGVSDGSEDVCRLAMKPGSDGGQPLSATSGGRPRVSRGAVSGKAGGTVSYLLRTARASRMA